MTPRPTLRFPTFAAVAALFALSAVPSSAQEFSQEDYLQWMHRLSTAGPALAPNEDTVGQGQLADGTLQSSVSAPPPMPRPHQSPPTAVAPAPAAVPVPAADTTGAATLLADNVDLTGRNVLTASGGVVIWFQGARLLASSVVYDGNSGRLQIQGPIHLTRPASAGTPDETVIIADQADLDEDLTDGVVKGARLVLAREMQLAANELQRTGGGRMTTLTHVVASSCQVCAENPTPLWEIRARKITHDSETGKLSFDRPQFRAFGLPIATLPALTAPGPNVDRMTGFLRPEIRTTTGLGFGVKLPYFITLGDSADLTLTPYLAASRTTTLGVRYRQMFSNGVTEWNGAITRDDIRPEETRGYLFGGARFLLPRDYQLGLQVQMTSDPAYLLDYDVTDADRLWSGVTLERYNLDRMLRTRIGNYQTLRDDENSSTTPALVADALSQRRFTPAWIGGTGWLEWSAHAHRRASPDDVVGRDVARASVALDWQRTQILSGGVVGAAQVRLDGDVYRIADDPDYDRTVGRATPAAGVELRWPLMAQSGGATHILEPMAQLVWSLPDHRANDDVPNEDSVLLEFDEGNLLSLNRAPGWDAREGGLRANLGVGWTRFDPAGWSLGVTAGRVYRADDDGGLGGPFTGRRSDWLLAAHYTGSHGLALSNRALFGDDLSINRNELRMGWLRPDLQVSAGYLWIDSDSEPGRDNDVSELTATTGWQVAEGWWANAETRYDFSEDRAQNAVLGMVYKNECVTVDLSVRRRFTSSDAVRPDTDFGLSVRLGGFGRQASSPGTVARRACLR